MKIAMWSGPRNLSTAMMYSFAARGDCAVWDEPFYAPYLAKTGIEHPMGAQIIAAHERDPEAVAARCAGPIPSGKPLFYMKHMPHHMVPGIPLDWAKDCVNVHLIRHPARAIASYMAKRENPTLDDIGYARQVEIFEEFGGVVIDSSDIRENPRGMLKKLCENIEIVYTDAMLSWPAGGRKEDGIWAKHWYGVIHNSTGFSGAEGPIPNAEGPLFEAALEKYKILKEQALSP